MSRFMSKHAAGLAPYVPGEQPSGDKFIKLNTNECPYPAAPEVSKIMEKEWKAFPLYPDPEAKALRDAIAERYGLCRENVFVGNGSDEVLAFAFLAFFDSGDAVYFPEPSYGFYPVYARLFGLNAHPVPLTEDFTLRIEDYLNLDGNILIANPNAPTGVAVRRDEIERIVAANPDRLVIVDEAYVDFAGAGVSSLPLLERYDNLLIVGTFSKSRALAGLRLGYAFSRPEHARALERIKFSFHPYNVSRVTQAAGIAAVRDESYLCEVLEKIKATRARVTAELRRMGLIVMESGANFVFAAHPGMGGGELAEKLRERKILVRFFDTPKTAGFVRVSIGTDAEMDSFLKAIAEIGQSCGKGG